MSESRTPMIPAAEWSAAAQVRRSCRRFDGRPVEPEKLAAMAELCERTRPWSGARIVLIKEAAAEVFRGFIGLYGKITGAPSVMLFVADRASEESLPAIGYASEAALLEATRLELATCWVGGGFRAGVASPLADLSPTERVVGVSPLGYPASRIVSGGSARPAIPRKRKELSVIAPGWEEWPDWARAGVTCARVAPSAMNRQPWRFFLKTGSTVAVAMDADRLHTGISKRIDVGIAMRNFEVAALAAGARGSWTLDAGPEIAHFDLSDPAPADGKKGQAG
jgi:nitroreductase